MNLIPLHSPSSLHPLRDGVLTRIHSVAVAAGFLARFAFLSILACLFLTSPISLHEVPYASHHPSPGR